jgi:Fe-S-cluster-containing dehydrogenase component/anaerobic selenocysteine-containing dehydrogenase
MMSAGGKKLYWKDWRDRETAPEPAPDEFAHPPDGAEAHLARRDFLKAAGFVFAGGMLGCSRAPVEKAIPYLIQPEEITPGRAAWYASTCGGCSAGCGVLVKTRDGRPVKLEGNPEHPWSRGGLCAVGQASLLGLYDSLRLKNPILNGREATWEEVDAFVTDRLSKARGGAVRFLSGPTTSPTLRASIQRFLGGFRDGRHVVYDSLSTSAILDAHEHTHGVRVLPRYHFDRADVIVSVDADFLGTWISPVEFTRAYTAGRNADSAPPRFSHHVQFESRLSLTGAKADRRVAIAPGEAGVVLTGLAARVARQAGAAFGEMETREEPGLSRLLDDLASRLWANRGRSLVVSGAQQLSAQTLCNFLNHLLANYGATLELEKPSYQRQGDDRDLQGLVAELNEGKVAAVFIEGVNPVYDLPQGEALARALERVPLVVSIAERQDETAAFAHVVAPDHHPLESWGDAEAVAGTVSLFQPAVNPLGGTRSALESLAVWSGTPKSSYDILREFWQAAIFPRQKQEKSFEEFWDHSVHDGFAEVEPTRIQPRPFNAAVVRPASPPHAATGGAFTLVLYPKVSMLDGRHAHNAWLHELPDPVTKVTWDNYACLSPAAASRLGVQDGDVVRIELPDGTGAKSLELPALIQPGQHDSTVAVALGYGRMGTERFARVGPRWLFGRTSVGPQGRVGKNTAPLALSADGPIQYERNSVRIVKTGAKYALASTQEHHSLSAPRHVAPRQTEPRPIVQEMTLASLLSGQGDRTAPNGHDAHPQLWPDDHPYRGHRWAMAVDLSACTGCSACVVACQAENNIPVVGKDEVRRQREMHWLRVDRYYAESSGGVDVAFQPMMCQHCDTAPCETVCPVLATVHSEEGLNQQIYNRCVGTRYCANNCPYKTRRFNWFDYPREDGLQNLVLNPDVTVRSRGVMEKCTFCVQLIQEAKIESKRTGAKLTEGSIRTACEQSCPAGAIVFGDLNDPTSRVARLAASGRAYRVLEELNFRPAVHYLKLVRHRTEEGEGKQHG